MRICISDLNLNVIDASLFIELFGVGIYLEINYDPQNCTMSSFKLHISHNIFTYYYIFK